MLTIVPKGGLVMLDACTKANILVEALPYIKKFAGSTVVIKYGGHAMEKPELQEKVMEDIILMKLVGLNPIVVHGGGPYINEWLNKLGKKSQFIHGLRVTDEEIMEVVEMVLVGKINKKIVNLINQQGGKAIGLSGKDGNLLKAKKQLVKVNDQMIDVGLVGQVTQVNVELLIKLTKDGYIPVIAPIGVGDQGESFNINADYVAGAVASALKAQKMVLLTDVDGIFLDSERKKLISIIKDDEAKKYIEQGTINGGMIPKVECCLEALENGVGRVHILDGRKPHAMLLEFFTNEGIGTMVVKRKE